MRPTVSMHGEKRSLVRCEGLVWVPVSLGKIFGSIGQRATVSERHTNSPHC